MSNIIVNELPSFAFVWLRLITISLPNALFDPVKTCTASSVPAVRITDVNPTFSSLLFTFKTSPIATVPNKDW